MTEQIANNSVKPLTQWVNLQQPLAFADYCQAGGYQGAKVALQHSPNEVLEIVKNSGLKGRGGAGFPTGMKWSFVPMFDDGDEDAPDNKYLVANADEMEPGTFKDRLLLDSEGAMRLTTARYYTPAGRSIQAKGIVPDIRIIQELPEDMKGGEEPRGEASLPGHLANENQADEEEKSGSSAYVPPDPKDDKQLNFA